MKFLLLLLLLGFPLTLSALEAGEALSDPQLEARAVTLGEGLRCLVCQGESVNDSPSPMARNLRGLLREKLKAGWSDDKIASFVTQRYGDYILLKPPIKPVTLPLWLAPWLFLGAGLGFYALYLKKTKKRQER